jgi:hypothetical protein
MNMIFDSDSSSVESNLDINNTYNPVNNDSSITVFGENDAFNFEAIPLSNESQGRGRGRDRGRGHPRTKTLKEINKPKLVWTQALYTPIIHAWERFEDLVGLRIRNTVEMTSHSWFENFFTASMISNIVQHTNEYM